MSLPFANSPADVVHYLLIALGLGMLPVPGFAYTATSWPVNAGQEPDSPDNTITLYNTTGNKHARIMIDGETVEDPGIQIRIRGTDDPTASIQAELIKVAIDEKAIGYNVQIGGHNFTVYAINRVGNPIQLGNESPTSRRRIYTINATVTLRQTT